MDYKEVEKVELHSQEYLTQKLDGENHYLTELCVNLGQIFGQITLNISQNKYYRSGKITRKNFLLRGVQLNHKARNTRTANLQFQSVSLP